MATVGTRALASRTRRRYWPLPAIAGLTFVIFLLDLALPTGVASGVPYILPVLLALRLRGSRGSLAVAAVTTVLTVLGFFLPPTNAVGEAFWVGVDNRFIAVLAIWLTAVLGYLLAIRDRDVHERESRLRTVVETSPDLILTLDGDGVIESCNASATTTFDRPRDRLIGQKLAQLIEPARPQSDGSLAADAVELIDEGRTGSGLCVVPGTTPRVLRWTVRPLEGTAGHRLAVGHDLTELLDAQARAVQAERLAAIGQTLATMSHESKNELLAIRFGLEQLGRCWDDREAAADMISALLESQDRLWRLFEDVRSFAAPVRLKAGRIVLQDVWRRAWQSVAERDLCREARFIEPADAGRYQCVGDAFRLEQVFRNLFENSLAAADGPVCISVSCSEELWRGETALLVRVRDDGPGLPDEARQRLFEPFFTTKPQGTGLGLALCRRILEAHLGDLFLGPDGAGAEFILALPYNGAPLPVETNAV